jgi:hypothetical protein
MTGKPLYFQVVGGADARKAPLMHDADLETSYIKVTLARPGPEHGLARVTILKTYRDDRPEPVDVLLKAKRRAAQ